VKALSLVSKKKRRYKADGYNFGLSYSTNNGFPIKSNWLDEVRRFLEDKQEDQDEQPVPREFSAERQLQFKALLTFEI
jgi:hypothetical protein